MNVKGLTGAASVYSSYTPIASTAASPTGLKDSKVTLSKMGLEQTLQLISDKSLQKIQEMTQLAAAKLGYDLNTIDTSPEATSDRISSFAINMFPLYQKQNPGLSEEEAATKYRDLIKNAVNDGYQEALAVLSSLNVGDKGILDTAKTTIDMTYQKIDSYFDSYLAQLTERLGGTDE
jgi:hypothetical protein